MRRQYSLHRKLQLLLGIILLVAVGAFEIDLQLIHGGWETILDKREVVTEAQRQTARTALHVHLLFAVTTPLLWLATIILALRRFDNPPKPGLHSRFHKTLGWASTADLVLTSITGLIFYYVAFVVPLAAT